jgi:hypothetical protein
MNEQFLPLAAVLGNARSGKSKVVVSGYGDDECAWLISFPSSAYQGNMTQGPWAISDQG